MFLQFCVCLRPFEGWKGGLAGAISSAACVAFPAVENCFFDGHEMAMRCFWRSSTASTSLPGFVQRSSSRVLQVAKSQRQRFRILPTPALHRRFQLPFILDSDKQGALTFGSFSFGVPGNSHCRSSTPFAYARILVAMALTVGVQWMEWTGLCPRSSSLRDKFFTISFPMLALSLRSHAFGYRHSMTNCPRSAGLDEGNLQKAQPAKQTWRSPKRCSNAWISRSTRTRSACYFETGNARFTIHFTSRLFWFQFLFHDLPCWWMLKFCNSEWNVNGLHGIDFRSVIGFVLGPGQPVAHLTRRQHSLLICGIWCAPVDLLALTEFAPQACSNNMFLNACFLIGLFKLVVTCVVKFAHRRFFPFFTYKSCWRWRI